MILAVCSLRNCGQVINGSAMAMVVNPGTVLGDYVGSPDFQRLAFTTRKQTIDCIYKSRLIS